MLACAYVRLESTGLAGLLSTSNFQLPACMQLQEVAAGQRYIPSSTAVLDIQLFVCFFLPFFYTVLRDEYFR